MNNPLRQSALTVFCAWIAFVLAGMGYQKMTESADMMHAANTYPLVGLAYNTIVAAAAIALLAVLAGGLPVAWAVIRNAARTGRRDVLALFAVPPVMFVLWLSYVEILLHTSFKPGTSLPFTPLKTLHAYSVFGLFGVAAVLSTWAVAAAIVRSPVNPRLFRFARVPAIVTTAAMAVMLLSSVVWGISLRAEQAGLFNGNGGLMRSSTAFSWTVQVVVMAAATVTALAGIRRARATGKQARAS